MKILGMLAELGYEGFAREYRVHASQLLGRDASTSKIPSVSSAFILSRFRQGICRLTLVVDNAEQLDLIKYASSAIPGGPEITAVEATSESAFEAACKHQDVDMISISGSSRLPYNLNPALVCSATSRGVFFEMKYAPALRSTTCRQYFFCNLIY